MTNEPKHMEQGLEFEDTDADIIGKSTPLIRASRDAARRLFDVKTQEDILDWWGHWGHLFEDVPVVQLTKTPENVTCAGLSNADGRQAALDALSKIDNYIRDVYQSDTDNDFVLYGFPNAFDVIRAALQSPRVPVITTALLAILETVNENPSAFSHDALVGIISRAYAALQKEGAR